MNKNLDAQKARENSNKREANFNRELQYALYAIDEATEEGRQSTVTYVVNAYAREVITELKQRGFQVNKALLKTLIVGVSKETAIKIEW